MSDNFAVPTDDIDNPEWSKKDFASAKPGYDMPDHLRNAFPNTRGRPVGSNKTLISLRLDLDIIEHFRASGTGWQSRINAVLKQAVKSEAPSPRLAE